MDTKERILMTALHLFARDGYEAVSVSMIAGALDMTKGALYRHYENKRAIFDSIVKRMFELDAERAKEYEVPEHVFEENPQEYEGVSVQQVKAFAGAQLRFWTEDDFASDFRKLLTLEQYRDEEMGKLYSDCILTGPVSYMEDIFREMAERGILEKADPKLLAVEFYGPLYWEIQNYDRIGDREEAQALLQKHMDAFFQKYRCQKERKHMNG